MQSGAQVGALPLHFQKLFFLHISLLLCRQSPIDISPGELLYDPGLREFSLTPNKVQGRVINTGHTVTFQVKICKLRLFLLLKTLIGKDP